MTNLEIEKAYVGNTQVEKIYLGADVIYESTPPIPVIWNDELRFDILSAGTIQFAKSASTTPTVVVEYSLDGVNWTSYTSSTTPLQIQVNAGDTVLFRGDNPSGMTKNTFYGTTALFNVRGYLMSIINSTWFTTASGPIYASSFHSLFQYTNVVDASQLIIPPANCSGDTNNYYSRFMQDCPYLTTSPVIPAGIYDTKANTYFAMFSGDTNLTQITSLGYGNSLACKYWVSGVAASGTFYKNPNVTVGSGGWSTGSSGIPSGWTVLDYNG